MSLRGAGATGAQSVENGGWAVFRAAHPDERVVEDPEGIVVLFVLLVDVKIGVGEQ